MLRRCCEKITRSGSLLLVRQLFVFAVIMVGFLSGCATGPRIDPPSEKLIENILSQTSVYSSEVYPQTTSDMLSLTDEMREFLDVYVDKNKKDREKVEQLFFAIIQKPGLNLQYNSDATFTSEQTFSQGVANCVGFSSLFIALAREVGIDASFQEVQLPPQWISFNSDTLIKYKHINVLVPLNFRRDAVVDFRYDRYSESYPQRIISDAEALGHFLSNFGAEEMLAGNLEKAKAYMLQALKASPKKSFVWNNMGIVLRRLGQLDLAEASYRQAIALDSEQVSALNNLSVIYEKRGDFEMAQYLREYGEKAKRRDPYYRYALAQNAYQKGEYDNALTLMNAVVRIYPEEHRFYHLRGLSLWRLGNTKKALFNVRRAMRVTSDEKQISQYQELIAKWQKNNS